MLVIGTRDAFLGKSLGSLWELEVMIAGTLRRIGYVLCASPRWKGRIPTVCMDGGTYL